jgi:hypothetical protein
VGGSERRKHELDARTVDGCGKSWITTFYTRLPRKHEKEDYDIEGALRRYYHRRFGRSGEIAEHTGYGPKSDEIL